MSAHSACVETITFAHSVPQYLYLCVQDTGFARIYGHTVSSDPNHTRCTVDSNCEWCFYVDNKSQTETMTLIVSWEKKRHDRRICVEPRSSHVVKPFLNPFQKVPDGNFGLEQLHRAEHTSDRCQMSGTFELNFRWSNGHTITQTIVVDVREIPKPSAADNVPVPTDDRSEIDRKQYEYTRIKHIRQMISQMPDYPMRPENRSKIKKKLDAGHKPGQELEKSTLKNILKELYFCE